MSEKTGMRLAPGPKERWGFWCSSQLENNPLGFLTRMQKQYGDIVHIPLGRGQRAYLLSHPDPVKHVLVDNAPNYPKPMGPPSLLTGNGLFKSEGDFWKKQRAMIQPAFHRERLTGLVGTIVDGTRAMLDRWEARARSGEPFDVAEEMARLALMLQGRIVFTDEPSEAVYEASRSIVHLIGHRDPFLQRMLPFLSSRRARFQAALQVLDELVYGHLARRRQQGLKRGDMLDMLMEVRDRTTGEGMSDRQIRDEAMNLFAAGYEATAAGLTWTWYLLHHHPEVRERLFREVSSVLGERLPTAQDVPRLRYATMVFEEAMRMYAPAWSLDRQAKAADQLGGYDVPPGTLMLMLPFILHRHPGLWENPDTFQPERFEPEHSTRRSRFAFIPFGAGQRLCIGNNLAMTKAPLILAVVVQRYRLDVVKKKPLVLHPAVTLTLEGGLEVVASPTSGGTRAVAVG